MKERYKKKIVNVLTRRLRGRGRNAARENSFLSYFKKSCRLVAPMVVVLLMATLTKAAPDQLKTHKFRNLPNLLRAADQLDKYVALTDFDDSYDESIYAASLEYLDTHPLLVERIRDDLESDTVNWQLEKLTHRMIYAPESDGEISGLFIAYCQEAIDDMIRLTGLVNPYSSISTKMKPDLDGDEGNGIRAVVVHDLATEYVANFSFSGDSTKLIKIGLTGRMSINEVGSYSSYLHYSPETGEWTFSHDKRTVWKIGSKNPYTVLMTPLEETLHILLRQYTERAILARILTGEASFNQEKVEDLVEEWLAVEEAVVGALVYTIVPEVLLGRIPDLPEKWVKADLATKDHFDKYRHLQTAIEMVRQCGLRQAIDLYSREPDRFREVLVLMDSGATDIDWQQFLGNGEDEERPVGDGEEQDQQQS